jgi:hypothetical protein
MSSCRWSGRRRQIFDQKADEFRQLFDVHGVADPARLEQAQTGGLTLFWAHKLNDMRTFIESTRP